MNDYLEWLRGIVGRSGDALNRQEAEFLMDKPFTPILDMDENRKVDGLVLRDIYEAETGKDSGMEGKPCTMLEMIIALARHMFSIMDGWIPDENNTIGRWFHEMLDNLEKPRRRSTWDAYRWDDAMETILNRTFDRNGRGGLFPRACCHEDQRKVELWDQMNGYLLDWYY